MAIQDQAIPGCADVPGHRVEFEALNLSQGKARPGRVRATLNASLGFGGANTCVILAAPDRQGFDSAPTIITPPRDERQQVLITGIGIVLSGAVGIEKFTDQFYHTPPPELLALSGPIPEEAYAHLLSARRVRRMSDYVKLTLAATTLAAADAALLPGEAPQDAQWSAILGSTHGSASYCYQYYRQIVDEGLGAANPMLFAEGVPNAAAAHLSMMLSLRGACQTIIGSRTSGLDALRLASLRIAGGQWDRAIVSAAEEFFPVVNDAYVHCGLHARGAPGRAFAGTGGFVTASGAVTLVLESSHAARERGARARGVIDRTAAGRTTGGDMPETLRGIIDHLGCSDLAFSSANATWIDRAESTAIGAASTHTRVETLYGRFPELFSVGPLASIAAGLLVDRGITSFNVLCTGYTGTASGARLLRA
jgi:3-oxoacyl-(acyl-carrier-protein) synthase